jgi:Aspartic acid proteinase inhibitor
MAAADNLEQRSWLGLCDGDWDHLSREITMKRIVQIMSISVLTAFSATLCLAQAGGFRELAVTDKDVAAAAKFAIEAQSKKDKVALEKIVKAEVQVVAGRNFRLSLDVRVEGGIRNAQVVVWSKLDKTYQLSKWEWKGDVRPDEKPK